MRNRRRLKLLKTSIVKKVVSSAHKGGGVVSEIILKHILTNEEYELLLKRTPYIDKALGKYVYIASQSIASGDYVYSLINDTKRDSNVVLNKILIGVAIAVIAGVITAYIIYRLGIN